MALPVVTNIGSRGRRRRYLVAAAGLGAGLLLAGGFVGLGMARGARLLVLLPFFVGALGLFQALAGT